VSSDHPPRAGDLFRIFAANVAAQESREAGATPTVDEAAARAALETLVAAAQAAHRHLAVDEQRFVAHVARHVPAAPADWAASLARIHAGDLYLAFACAEQVPGALAVFEASCGALIDNALSGQATAAFAEDAKQLMREKLFIGDGDPGAGSGDGPRVLSYAGRGPLAAWVAVSAQRTALSLRRREVSTRARHIAAARDELAAAIHPELAYLKRTYRAAFAESFEGAFAQISDRERTLLRLHLLSRLTLEQIAPMFHVNTSTVSRWLAKARETLLARTREGLSLRLNVQPDEFASMARLLGSQIDVSLARLLAEDPKAGSA
jgi:RNA polymerase sigma-70 factor (ECF subfamily)